MPPDGEGSFNNVVATCNLFSSSTRASAGPIGLLTAQLLPCQLETKPSTTTESLTGHRGKCPTLVALEQTRYQRGQLVPRGSAQDFVAMWPVLLANAGLAFAPWKPEACCRSRGPVQRRVSDVAVLGWTRHAPEAIEHNLFFQTPPRCNFLLAFAVCFSNSSLSISSMVWFKWFSFGQRLLGARIHQVLNVLIALTLKKLSALAFVLIGLLKAVARATSPRGWRLRVVWPLKLTWVFCEEDWVQGLGKLPWQCFIGVSV